MSFEVGDEVVFIGPGLWTQWLDLLEMGYVVCQHDVVYTVRAVIPCPVSGDLGLLLKEIVNPPHPLFGHEHAFYAGEFRKVLKRKTDISIFTKLLNPTKELV